MQAADSDTDSDGIDRLARTALAEPPIPADDAQRSAAVRACGLLDQLRAPELDGAARRAAAACRTPVALVTLVADDRWWVAGAVGTEEREAPRRASFCAHAITSRVLTVVPDARCDPRFAAHPLVVSGPRLRFWAAAPLIDHDGHVLGTVCVADAAPRELTAEQGAALAAIADDVVAHLQQRRVARAIDTAQEVLGGERAVHNTMIAAALDAIVIIGADGIVLEFNPAAEALFGYARADALGRAMSDLIVPEDLRERHQRGLARLLAGGEAKILNTRVEIDAERRDGAVFPIELTVTQLTEDPPVFCGHIRDLSERRRAEADQSRLTAIVQSSQDAIVGLDRDRVITHWNGGAADLYGYTAPEMIGHTLAAILPADRAVELDRALDCVLERREVSHLDTRRLTKDGRAIDVSITLSPVIDSTGRLLGVSSIARDIGELKRFEARLRHEADHDPLTGLVNRRVFAARLEELARDVGGEGRGAIVLMDLDHFKLVNDSFGHRAGDEMLRTVSAALRACVREGDTVARLGGDEFAVLLPGCPQEEAMHVAEALIAKVAGVTGGHDGAASAGVAGLNPGVEARDVMAAADMALYEAKATGRRRAVLHRDGADGTLQGVVDVRAAIADGRLVLYAQPIIDLRTGLVESHELLVRMCDAEGTLLAPGRFIPIAERFGLIEQIDWWVLRRACEHARNGLKVAANLSAHTIANPETTRLLTSEIAAGVPSERLTFEITETAALYDLDAAREFALHLTGLGCGLALDDFGTGFGSLLHLKHLPVTQLKIDREFVGRLATEPSDRHIVEGLVGIAGALGVDTVAEGVEDATTLACLAGLGVDLAQGYHIARPAPVETIAGPLLGTIPTVVSKPTIG